MYSIRGEVIINLNTMLLLCIYEIFCTFVYALHDITEKQHLDAMLSSFSKHQMCGYVSIVKS